MVVIEAEPGAIEGRFAIVVAQFNRVITSKLLDGALATLTRYSISEVDVFWVPGSFEIPLTAQRLASTGNYQAVICLGCIVRGDTDHYTHVANGAAQGISTASLSSNVPIIFGVLTTDSVEQALQRAGPNNSGAESASTAIAMARLFSNTPFS